MWLRRSSGVPYAITKVHRSKRDRQGEEGGGCDSVRDWPERWMLLAWMMKRLKVRNQATYGRYKRQENGLHSKASEMKAVLQTHWFLKFILIVESIIDVLILTQWALHWSSGLQNCKIIKLGCIKSLSYFLDKKLKPNVTWVNMANMNHQ